MNETKSTGLIRIELVLVSDLGTFKQAPGIDQGFVLQTYVVITLGMTFSPISFCLLLFESFFL
jgi:hypothetical protein